MSSLHLAAQATLWLWLASLAGAAIFVALGLVLGRAQVARVQAKCAALEADNQQQRRAELTARVTLRDEAEALRAELASSHVELGGLKTALAELERERGALTTQRAELHRQLEEVAQDVEQSFRHDLALAREHSRTLEEKVRRLEEAHTAARAEADALVARSTSQDALERELESLRARALAIDLAAPPLTAPAGTHALDTIPTRLLAVHPVRAAVIGDELGLVVSCQGNHADELAALGALFNRACSEARRILPLGRVVRITIEDERRIHLTMRPLRTEAAAAEDQLTLVTLSNGFEPDSIQVNRIVSRASVLEEHGGHATAAT